MACFGVAYRPPAVRLAGDLSFAAAESIATGTCNGKKIGARASSNEAKRVTFPSISTSIYQRLRER